MHHAEERLWDIWNGRWSRQTISSLLLEHSGTLIPPTDYVSAIHWLTNLTLLLQKTQTALYSTRRQILRQLDLLPRPTNITLRRPSSRPRGPRTQTLFSAWNIHYSRTVRQPKRPPRYLGRCDLAPQRAPLRQTILGYRGSHPLKLPGHRTVIPTSSHRKRAPTQFQLRRSKVTQR